MECLDPTKIIEEIEGYHRYIPKHPYKESHLYNDGLVPSNYYKLHLHRCVDSLLLDNKGSVKTFIIASKFMEQTQEIHLMPSGYYPMNLYKCRMDGTLNRSRMKYLIMKIRMELYFDQRDKAN